MAGFLKLPVELLDLTLESLAVQSLSRLSLTCKDLEVLATPYLYRNVELNWKEEDYQPPPYASLLLAVLGWKLYDSWDATTHVNKEEPGDDFITGWLLTTGTKLEYSSEERRRALLLVKSLQCSEAGALERWQADFSKGEIDVFIALSLLQFTNLQQLVVDNDYLQTDYMDTTFQNIGVSQSHRALWKITLSADIECGEDIFANTSKFDCVLSVLKLPGVHTLDTSRRFEPFHNVAQVSPALTNLSLRHTQLNCEDLDEILSATPMLEPLSFHTSWNVTSSKTWRPEYNYPMFDGEIFLTSLRHVRRTLKSLILSLDWFRFNEDDDPQDLLITGDMKELKSFPSLQHLAIPVDVLLHKIELSPTAHTLAQIFSLTLECLILTDESPLDPMMSGIGHDITSVVSKYLQHHHTGTDTQKLLHVTLHFLHGNGWFDSGDQGTFRAMCARAGISCVLPVEE